MSDTDNKPEELVLGDVIETVPTRCEDVVRWSGGERGAVTLTIREIVGDPTRQHLTCDGCDETWTETRR